MDAWRALARRHLVPRAEATRRCERVVWRRVREGAPEYGPHLAELLADVAAGGWAPAAWLEPPPGARLLAAGGADVGVTLYVVALPGRALRDLAYAGGVMLPALRGAAALLREAAPGAAARRRAVAVTWLPGGARRGLPRARGEPIAPEHINGGVTFVRDGRVLVYRAEDALRVALHELLHALGVDAALWDAREADARVAAALGVRPEGRNRVLGLAECYVEVLACVLHAAWAAACGAGWDAALAAHGRHHAAVARRVAWHNAGAGAGAGAVVERTHGVAYTVCKAAVWRRLGAFLEGFARPGAMLALPGDAERFAEFVISSVRADGAAGPPGHGPGRGGLRLSPRLWRRARPDAARRRLRPGRGQE